MSRDMERTALDSVGISIFHNEPIILQKINMDNNNEKTMKEQGLSLNSANLCSQRGLDDDSSAGANAGSRTEMMFVTTNTLSELVWSPHKGLSLKCADCSLTEKKPSLWGTGSRNMGPSPPEGITAWRTNNDGPGPGGNLISSPKASHFKSEDSDRFTLARSLRGTIGITPVCGTMDHEHNQGSGGIIEDLNTTMEVCGLDFNQKADDQSEKEEKGLCCATDIQITETSGSSGNMVSSSSSKPSLPGPEIGRHVDSSSKMDECKPNFSQVEPRCGDLNEGTSSNPFDRTRDVGRGTNHTPDKAVVLASEVSMVKGCKALNTAVSYIKSPDRKLGGSVAVTYENSKSKMKTPGFANTTLEKHELTVGNDLHTKSESIGAEVGITVVSQHADEGKDSPQQDEGTLPKDQGAPGEAFPNNCGACLYQRKDKEKVLSVQEDNERIREQDDSHESVESSNSVGSFSGGKRPWSLEQKLIVNSKKLKKQMHESPSSASFTRQYSSFLNWISNMMKGLSKSDPDETPLALTMTPHHGHASHDQHLMPCDKNQDPACRSMGFQTIFQSLYLPSKRVQDLRSWNLGQKIEEDSKELDLANIICDNSGTPPARGEMNDLIEQLPMSNEKFNQGTSRNGEGPSSLPNAFPSHIDAQVNHKTKDTLENNNSCIIACITEKGGVGSSKSSFQSDSNSPSERKEAHGFIDLNKSSTSITDRSSPLCSAWITRFCPKVMDPLLSPHQCQQTIGEYIEGPTDCIRLLPQPQNHVISSKDQNNLEDGTEHSDEDQMDVVSMKTQNHAIKTTTFLGLKRTKGHTDQKFKSPIQPFQRFRSSEDMASVFARRLDALRNIMPSEVADNATHATTSCLFCGIKGHNLQDCSEVCESELEDLLQNISSNNGAEESPSLCIRCLQLNHWAIACPNASLRRESYSNGNAFLDNFKNCGKMQHCPGNNTLTSSDERNLKHSEYKDSHCHVAGACKVRSRVETELLVCTSVNKNLSGIMVHNEQVLDLKPVMKDLKGNNHCEGMMGQRSSRECVLNRKQTASCSADNELKENLIITPLSSHVSRHIPDVPRGTFEAIRRLRLSRTDILKWMTSPISDFCLEGFFLRLRLGRWEEGLGGTGYYVACINGSLRERSFGSSEISLSVNIGGVKCLVESRYVSNQDFIEDELMAWWSTTSRCGGTLPSEEDLKMKLEERKKLGF